MALRRHPTRHPAKTHPRACHADNRAMLSDIDTRELEGLARLLEDWRREINRELRRRNAQRRSLPPDDRDIPLTWCRLERRGGG